MGIDAEMFVRTRATISDEEVRRLSWEVAEAFGADRFWIWNHDSCSGARRAIERVEVFDAHDAELITPELGETFLVVNPCTRFYGEGYERGDLPFLIALAQWLEIRVPGGEVWYGGDSSGEEAKPFDEARRVQLFQHFATYGHRPYAGDPRTGNDDHLARFSKRDQWATRTCDFCQQPMMRNGWGGDTFAAMECYGCGKSETTNDGGKTWKATNEVGGHAPRQEVLA